MTDWRVRLAIIPATVLLVWGLASAWTEHQCETARYERYRRNPPPPQFVTQCVCADERQEQAQSTQGNAPECDWPEMNSNQALVVVGIITFVALLWQANETRRAAAATRDSVQANERHFRLLNQQWMDFDNWNANVNGGVADISFDIINRTKMAVTLTIIRTRYFRRGAGRDWELELAGNDLLIPNRPYQGSAADYDLSDTAVLWQYMTSEHHLTLLGQIEFIDAFGQKQVQPFGRWIALSNSRPAEFREFDAHVHQVVFGDQGQRPEEERQPEAENTGLST
jgi:hypothetical protein